MLIYEAIKSDKKSLHRFYKSQQYSAKFMGLDKSYIIKSPITGDIIASVIISKIRAYNHQYFLHALVVDALYQNKGLATALINYVSTIHQPLVCFSIKSLSKLYLQAGMKELITELVEPEHIDVAKGKFKLSTELSTRYSVYSKKQKSLTVFIKIK